MELKFHKIGFENVFAKDFAHLTENNTINFSIKDNKGIVVIYGPNGTGKTSLSKVLSGVKNSEIEYSIDGSTYSSASDNFFVISDQNSRNIISGKTDDFVMGYNIKHEAELYEFFQQKRDMFQNDVYDFLKERNITKKHPLLINIDDGLFQSFVSDCANQKSKGKEFTPEEMVAICSHLSLVIVPEYDADCMNFLIENYGDDEKAIVNQIEDLAANLATISMYKNYFVSYNACDIAPDELLIQKTINEDILKDLESRTNEIIQEICKKPFISDPFGIKESLLHHNAEMGTNNDLAKIIILINKYKQILLTEITNNIIEKFEQYNLLEIYYEYSYFIELTPEITDNDFNVIKLIVEEGMDKQLNVKRDKTKKLIITISKENGEEQNLIGESREKLHLSAGEQNFLSLAFEFLRAKNTEAPIIVIDDPISSFDSIYKNKVVYAIVRILQNKKRIILTHNIDLIYLLHCQFGNCFNLYYFNNTIGDEVNGFIPFNKNEQKMLISLEKLLSAFRTTVQTNVKNVDLFLISMIPFMRGYANITNQKDIRDELTKVMHGYMSEVVDIAYKYTSLFGKPNNSIIKQHYLVSVGDIIAKVKKENDFVEIIDKKEFPQLNRTLNHSLQYLYLRLIVEKTLVDKFGIDTHIHRNLGGIISEALSGEDQIKNRIRLVSKKTLINDFNHFEVNLSIFQPAIDITDRALKAERDDIIKFVEEIKNKK